jgi:hypothetical protein
MLEVDPGHTLGFRFSTEVMGKITSEVPFLFNFQQLDCS